MPVAGNHDSWTNSPYDEDFLNYTIDNYRFIALSHELNNAPAAVWSNLESQLRSSCQDNRPIIFYYHYAPNGFIEADLQMSPTAWNSLNQLLQRYPVIAYLGGHIHTRINRTYTPGFFAQTISSSGTSQDYQIYTLANGSINIQNSSDPNNPLLIIEPKQYFSGLDYTKTPKSNRNIKVYAKTYNGSVTQVKYKINSSPSANLTRLGTSDYYQAEIDTNSLTGPHTLQVDMITTSSNIGQSLTINFADSVRTRTASGCSLSPTPTKQPPTPIATSTRSPGSPPTEPPQPTSIPVDPASCTGCYGYAQTCLRGCPLTNVCVIPPGSATACGWEAYRCCQPVLLPSPSPVPQFQCHCPRTPDLKPQGDANCDGTINQNQTDFGIWSNEFLNFSSGRHQALWRADFNCDRKVDIHDFNIWKSN
jgi:hypothetical protein